MSQINFEPEARQALMRTYADDTEESLSNLYDYYFDWLQADPVDPRARLHPFSTVDAWIIYVELPGRSERWAIIWTEDKGQVYVLHVGIWP